MTTYAVIRRPTELDCLFNAIVSDKLSIDKTTSYLAHYYPKLKSIENIELLTLTLFKSKIFANISCFSVDVIAKLIDVYQYVLIEKYKITNPTIPFIEFYKSIYKTMCYTVTTDPDAYWKIIPVITGCISALSPMMRYNPYPVYSNVLHKTHKLFIELYDKAILSVMRANLPSDLRHPFLLSMSYIQEYLSNSLLESLILTSPNILSDITGLIFMSNEGLNNGSKFLNDLSYKELLIESPVLRSLNKWAFLYSKLVQRSSFQTAANSIAHITEFSSNIVKSLETIENSTDKWDLVKYCFFSIIIMFESLMGMVLTSKATTDLQFVIFNQIHRTLFNFSYVLDHIGTGGFESYNFVFDSSTTLFQRAPQCVANLGYSLLNELSLLSPPLFGIEKSKLDYFLRWTESLLPALDELFLSSSLLPLLNKILNTDQFAISTVEFSHSIMIKYISTNNVSPVIFTYLDRTLSQFPQILSLQQTSIIVETCASKCDSATSIFDLVKFHISMSSYSPLPPRKEMRAEKEVIITENLNTRKAGLTKFLIDIVQHIEPSNFVFSLFEIKAQIDNLIGDRDVYKLYDLLWDKILMINKVNTWKGQAGLAWWYDNVNNGQVPHL